MVGAQGDEPLEEYPEAFVQYEINLYRLASPCKGQGSSKNDYASFDDLLRINVDLFETKIEYEIYFDPRLITDEKPERLLSGIEKTPFNSLSCRGTWR